MREPFRNAFTINKLGGGFFPFSVSTQQYKSGVASMDICALRVEDISDLIGEYAQQTYIVYDVDNPVMHGPATHRLLEFDEIVSELNVSCRIYGPRVIAISEKEFDGFAKNLPHYNFNMFDLRSEPNDEAMASLYRFVTDYDFEEPMLNRVSEARLFLHSHDDCYMYVEARDESFLKSVFARTLWIYCRTVTRSRFGRTREDIPKPPLPFVETIFPLNSAMTILRKNTEVRRDGSRLVIQMRSMFSATTWNMKLQGKLNVILTDRNGRSRRGKANRSVNKGREACSPER